MAKDKIKFNSFVVDWSTNVSSQNSFNSDDSDLSHLDKKPGVEDSAKISAKQEEAPKRLSLRGLENHAPQKDLELGRRSTHHRNIADRISYLVAGREVVFISNDDAKNEEQIKTAEKWRDELGLGDCRKCLSNGLVYQSLSSIIVTQSKMKVIDSDDVSSSEKPQPMWFSAVPSEQLRFSEPEINENAAKVVNHHLYHDDWLYKDKKDKRKTKTVRLPQIVSIDDYIKNEEENKNNAYYVLSSVNKKSIAKKYVSFAFTNLEGIFDTKYPLPIWKTNTAINDIQSQSESSNIRLDFLRNGLHVFAVINIYSKSFKDFFTAGKTNANKEWAEQLDIVKQVKSSYNSGKIIINPLYTEDPEKDGLIEVKKIDLEFPHESYKSFNEEATANVLSAWSVQADLFGITIPQGSNLRSQEGFMRVAIMMLYEKVGIWQTSIEKGINNILRYYGLNNISAIIKPHKTNTLLLMMIDVIKEYMLPKEIRDLVALDELDDESLEKLMSFNKSITKTPKNVSTV